MKARSYAFSLVLGLIAAACAPEYDHTDITGVKGSDLGGTLNKAVLTVPEGLVIKAHIDSRDDDNKQMPIVLRSLDPSIVEVAGVVSDHDYAFLGLKAGRTQIELTAGDTVVLTIDAQVAPQAPVP